MGLGSESYGEFSDEFSKNVIKYQIEKGITFFDTSIVMEMVGVREYLRCYFRTECKENLSVATKVGLLPHKRFYAFWFFIGSC